VLHISYVKGRVEVKICNSAEDLFDDPTIRTEKNIDPTLNR